MTGSTTGPISSVLSSALRDGHRPAALQRPAPDRSPECRLMKLRGRFPNSLRSVFQVWGPAGNTRQGTCQEAERPLLEHGRHARGPQATHAPGLGGDGPHTDLRARRRSSPPAACAQHAWRLSGTLGRVVSRFRGSSAGPVSNPSAGSAAGSSKSSSGGSSSRPASWGLRPRRLLQFSLSQESLR